jgi:hypothetical protein
MFLFRALPLDLVHNILAYNRGFAVKNGKLVDIHRLDLRKYAFLLDLPKIKALEDDVAEVVLPIRNSNCYFCLLYIQCNAASGLELQKLCIENGTSSFLDYVTYNVPL